jgi:hypothetical protein
VVALLYGGIVLTVAVMITLAFVVSAPSRDIYERA